MVLLNYQTEVVEVPKGNQGKGHVKQGVHEADNCTYL
jgi:hypothetical protein